MRKLQRVGIICLIVLGTIGYQLWRMVQVPTVDEIPVIACTEEALVCPDGSGVGRQGTTCTFAPCPQQPSFTGMLVQQGDEYRLAIPAPLGVGTGVTYALPVIFSTNTDVVSMVGKEIQVLGAFTEGSLFTVASTTVVDAPESDVHSAVVSVGGSTVIGGMRVTLHEVVADNRCPIDVQCIEAGAITARVTLDSDTDHETFNMPSDEVPHPFDTFTVAIGTVSPDAVSTQPIDPSEYQVTFVVDQLAE